MKSIGWALLLIVNAGYVGAAPYLPTNDSDVVERLPLTTDPAARQVESVRRQLAARPDDAGLRIDIARRYFNLAMAQGDPRLVGYASAAIAPLAAMAAPAAASSAPGSAIGSAAKPGSSPAVNTPVISTALQADYWLVRGQIEQYSHNFDGALSSLATASRLAPKSAEPLAWRAAVFMVQAHYAEAEAECAQLAPLAQPLMATGCRTYVQATTGQLQLAFDQLGLAAIGAAAATPAATPELLAWAFTRLADMASRLQQNSVAESYFRQAMALGVQDQYLLGAYADFLLAKRRPVEAIKLLAGWERSDILLLRLALAGRAANDARADNWAAQLRDRFQAAALRGDRLHEQEAARFELDIERNPARALAAASSNYTLQKEARDAEILLRAALAAKDAKAAQPALDWLRTSRFEDRALSQLASQLAALGTTK